MEELFREHSQKIRVYLAVPSQEDPFEKNISITSLPSLPINAIVSDLTFGKVQWTMTGITTDSAKELIIEKRHENLIEQSYKIEIDNILYDGYRINGKMQKKTEGNYVRIYCYRKKETE